MEIDNEMLYGPCPCGSGKNFKFCCWPKCRDELHGDFSRAELLQAVRGAAEGDGEEVCKPAAKDLLTAGKGLLTDGQRKLAWQFFVKARTVDPKARQAWLYEAQCAWCEGYVDTAYDAMKRGIEACPGRNTRGFASMAVFSRVLGGLGEAVEWLERALEDRKPASIKDAVAVCFALGVFRRHRDLVDYATDSGMDENGMVAFYKATALANLDEFEQARKALEPALRKQIRGARDLARALDEEMQLRSFFGGWPYLNRENFPLAACFDEDVREGRNPFLRHTAALPDIFEALIADDMRTPEELLSLLDTWTDGSFDGMRKKLQECADADAEERKEKDRPPEGVIAVRDDRDGSLLFNDARWRLEHEIGEGDEPEDCAAEIVDRLVRPYVERYCEFPEGEGGRNRPIVLLQTMKQRGEHDGDAPFADAGTEKEYWDMLRAVLAQIFLDSDEVFFTCDVMFDSTEGGPIVTIEDTQGHIDVLMVCLLEKPGEKAGGG